MLTGKFAKSGIPALCLGAVDVRDVALAHILAAENTKAHGRYVLCTAKGISWYEMSQIVVKNEKYAKYPIPDKEDGDSGVRPQYNCQKAENELGITLRSIETSVLETLEEIVRLGLVTN